MKFEQYYFQEKFVEYFRATNQEKQALPEDLVPLFEDPTPKEINDLCKQSEFEGCRIGVDTVGKIFVWNETVTHHSMQNKLTTYDGDKPGLKNIKFTAKFIYTKGDPRLMLSTEQMDVKSEEDLLKIISKINLKKLKLYFPMIKTINESEKHKTIYTFK